jgi:gliding motility-associated protein GldM
MGHGKESPRQKMIGMMYLVLTAMLALNVSKEAVKAFVKVDEALTLTVSNYSKKNDLIYKDFDRAAAENPTKASKFKTAAYAVKERADEAFNFLQGLKIEIINTADGPGNAAVVGNEVLTEKVLKFDDSNVPSQILIGADENGKANDLKAVLNEYRDFLITTIEGKNPMIEESLRKSLSTEPGKNEKTGETERWENATFQTLPVVAVIAMMSEFQVNVRNAETEVLNYLYTQIDASSFKFNKLDAIVIPTSSNYVTLGSDYEAQVFISASDSTQTPTITVGGAQLPIDDSGKGIYKAKATSIGPKKWGGIIALKAPDGSIKNYEFKSEYSVGEPNVIVSPTAMNIMYNGIPNPIDVSVPGVSPDKIKIKVNNGTFTTEKVKNSKGEPFKGGWAVRPNAVGVNVEVIVSAEMNGKTVQLAPYMFRVKKVPPPIASFADKSQGSVGKALAIAQQGVFAKLPDFDFDLTYEVTEFTLFYTDKGADFEEKSSSYLLTSKQKSIINAMTRGKTLLIKDIKAKQGADKPVDVPPIVLKIE